MLNSIGYAALAPDRALQPIKFLRRELRPKDIQFQILYCGICHTDLHFARNEWNNTIYPVVPGHEIIGRVINIGKSVTKFSVGDQVAVGCMIDACRTCDSCSEGLEQYCQNGFIGTYNSKDRETGEVNFGGYSDSMIVTEDFLFHLPKNLDIKASAPLVCAGVTTYSPLKYWKVGRGVKVGIVGLGGLGHMAIKLASALSAEVTLITTSPNKEADAIRLGANHVIFSKNENEMKKNTNKLDFILNTIPDEHDINPYIDLLKRDGTIVMVGGGPIRSGFDSNKIIFGRKNVTGSLISGIRETQELLDFCALHQILPEVEIIDIQNVNDAFERLKKADVKYRFVIDMSSLKFSPNHSHSNESYANAQ